MGKGFFMHDWRGLANFSTRGVYKCIIDSSLCLSAQMQSESYLCFLKYNFCFAFDGWFVAILYFPLRKRKNVLIAFFRET